MSTHWTEDPRPPVGASHTEAARRIIASSGNWYLAARRQSTIGPFPTMEAALDASRALDSRLRGVDERSAQAIIQSLCKVTARNQFRK
jgi:hypothetical protein